MYLFVLLLILSIFYFIFEWKHNLYGKYKHESCFIKLDYIQLIPKEKLYYIKFKLSYSKYFLSYFFKPKRKIYPKSES